MRILLITGGIYLLAVMPVTAQEASDSTRILAVPSSIPAAPNMQELFVGAADAVSSALSGPGAIGVAGAALVAWCLSLVLKAGAAPAGVFRNA